MSNIVTPYLPSIAEAAARGWMAGGKPAFIRALEHNMTEAGCPNCGGCGGVYVTFCSGGPFKSTVLGKTVYTWFDGDGRYGKGWYTIDRTEAYTCPECKGQDHKSAASRPTSPRPTPDEIKAIIARAAERMEKDGQRRSAAV